MPLIVHNAPDAVRIRKSNPVAAWGNRRHENRVEPVTQPAFDVPFTFKRRERIFTIGSCFARNVEKELLARGYRIPMLDLLAKPAFDGVDAGVVNNFGTPSIYNELAWAFGAETFDEERGFVEVQNGRFIDLHMISSIKPAPLDLLQKRRKALNKAIRMLKKCRVLIMTLGLVELWWDTEAQVYLNTAPLPSILKSWPGRFELHVLTFEECRDYLDRALDLCFEHGHRNLQIILTVSPVPMMLTHRRMDVITANSYSKSVLRSVAEHIVSARERVCYFPSYESVTHSDRSIAWTDDFVHVTEDIVALNVERMVNAFTGTMESDPQQTLPTAKRMPSESADALVLAERAAQARLHDDAEFFAQNVEAAENSPAFRLEYARYLADTDDDEQIVSILCDDDRPEALLLRAQSHLNLEHYDAAIECAERVNATPSKSDLHWRILVRAATAKESVDMLFDIERRWNQQMPRHQYFVNFWIGRALRILDHYGPAIERLKLAEISGEQTPVILAELARALIGDGQPSEAIAVLDKSVFDNDRQLETAKRLKTVAKNAIQKDERLAEQ